MDLDKIQSLTETLKTIQGFKFSCCDSGRIQISSPWFTKKQGEVLCDELNTAIGPIVQKIENELRRQLALCAKIKD